MLVRKHIMFLYVLNEADGEEALVCRHCQPRTNLAPSCPSWRINGLPVHGHIIRAFSAATCPSCHANTT